MISLLTPVDIRRFPWVKKLAADYAFQFHALAPFFAGDPASSDSWTAAIARAQSHQRPRADISSVLVRQLESRGAPAAARDAARRLADPKTVAVLTGQQAGLFGGPLFTLYKALTAVRLAARVEQEHGVPAVPVFWVESEDHDWNEVASVSVLDASFQPRTISLPAPPGAGQTSICKIVLGAEAVTAVDELAAVLGPTEFTSELTDLLKRTYAPGTGMSTAFARLLDALLGQLGIVVFDCSDRQTKRFVAPVFARELATAGRTWTLAGEAGTRLNTAGYHTQVDGAQDGAALFLLDGGRTPITADRARALHAAVDDRPEAFSPNVLLRPIVEDALFPTIAYVSGPSELAYLAQLRGVYEHFGVPMPLIVPRASLTLLDSASARFLEKNDVAFEQLQARDESMLNRLLAASLPEHVDRALAEADAAVLEKLTALIAAVPAVDATLEGAARSTLGKVQHDLATLRGKVIAAAKKRDETLRRQFHRVQALAFPDGVPQERALGIVAMYNRYGPALVSRLASDLPLDAGQHWVLTL